jgi:DNA gyrase subunit A
MTRQLNLLNDGNGNTPEPSGQGERLILTALHTEMQQSYLEYAMSVIVGRALPDVRDGLKPVHRRILYAMHELGLTPDRPYRKCARVVGDVLGKYHPHGDQAVYDALVRMVQDFASRYPLLAGHGNFGSVDDDPPAAMRYTETRLASVSHQVLLSEIGDDTVEFVGNFDNSQEEPVVLPAQLPVLLLNGCTGIAVGMATNIPPHNLGEVVDALVALIDRPHLSDQELFEMVPGPDFPTGGIIIGTNGIRDAYTTGRGSISLRGVVQMEEFQPGKGRHRRSAIIITELPFQVNKAGLLEKIAELINQNRLEGIADLRDESDREGMRVVIELKREAHPQAVLEQLYRQTALQNNFGVIMLAIADGQPRQMGLRQVLQEFLDFREQTATRRYQHQLDQTQARQHLVAGSLIALDNLDQVIEILRRSADGSTAKQTLQANLGLSERQADAILAMPLRRLTSLEQQNLREEAAELQTNIEQLEILLGSRHELFKAIKKELRGLKRQFADPRRTQILADAEPVDAKKATLDVFAADTPVQLEVNQRGYIRASRGERSRRSPATANGNGLQELKKDLVVYSAAATLGSNLLVMTASGKALSLPVQEIPNEDPRGKRGTPLVTLLPDSAQDEAIVSQWVAAPEPAADTHLVVLTAQARLKRIELAEFAEITGRGLSFCKLKDPDQVLWVGSITPDLDLVLATSTGRVLRFGYDEIPLQARTALGQPALKLGKQESLVGAVAMDSFDNLLLLTQKGYAKQMPVSAVRQNSLGDIGTQCLEFAQRQDQLVAIMAATGTSELQVVTDQNRGASVVVADIPLWGKDGPGKRLLTTTTGECIVTVVPGS